MTWGIVVQRPITEVQIPGYSDPFQASPRLPTAADSGKTISTLVPRTLSVNIRETRGNDSQTQPVVWV
jgi:hypothetical protein